MANHSLKGKVLVVGAGAKTLGGLISLRANRAGPACSAQRSPRSHTHFTLAVQIFSPPPGFATKWRVVYPSADRLSAAPTARPLARARGHHEAAPRDDGLAEHIGDDCG
jgi:hypothetical protein